MPMLAFLNPRSGSADHARGVLQSDSRFVVREIEPGAIPSAVRPRHGAHPHLRRRRDDRHGSRCRGEDATRGSGLPGRHAESLRSRHGHTCGRSGRSAQSGGHRKCSPDRPRIRQRPRVSEHELRRCLRRFRAIPRSDRTSLWLPTLECDRRGSRRISAATRVTGGSAGRWHHSQI